MHTFSVCRCLFGFCCFASSTGESNPGPYVCRANALPLSYTPVLTHQLKVGMEGEGAGFCFVFSIALAFDPLTLSEHKHQIDLVIGWHLTPQLAPCGWVYSSKKEDRVPNMVLGDSQLEIKASHPGGFRSEMRVKFLAIQSSGSGRHVFQSFVWLLLCRSGDPSPRLCTG